MVEGFLLFGMARRVEPLEFYVKIKKYSVCEPSSNRKTTFKPVFSGSQISCHFHCLRKYASQDMSLTPQYYAQHSQNSKCHHQCCIVPRLNCPRIMTGARIHGESPILFQQKVTFWKWGSRDNLFGVYRSY